MARKPRKAADGMCSWRCGRPVTPGRSRLTFQLFKTCGPCRKRYKFTSKIHRLQKQIDEGKDPLLAIAARLRLDSLLADYQENPERFEWTPEDDETDVLPAEEYTPAMLAAEERRAKENRA